MAGPVVLKAQQPEYPASAWQNGLIGTPIVSITVLPDGSVDNVQVVQGASAEMDKATVETVKTWKFKPAMCGTEPITLDIKVEVNFHITR
jgi:protein TonB